jgi:hypothetical protein
MSDFDTVLERLLVDPSFQAALATDPDRALTGYQLDPEERQLLGTRFSAGDGSDRLVETRTSKSGVVGLLGPVAAAFGVAAGAQTGTQSMGPATPTGAQSMGLAPAGPAESFGSAPGQASFGTVTSGQSSMGEVAGATESWGAVGAEQSMGSAPGAQSLGDVQPEAVGYHTRVDVDGDGRWDANTAYERADGGVDIRVDRNHDGVADFVGRDYDRDGRVDDADFDLDGDGTRETRMYDDNGDGWMDRRTPAPPA